MTWRLYFATDEDWEGIEDCFILARSEAEAELTHVESDGVDPELTFAHDICDVPDDLEARAIAEHLAWSREHAPHQADEPDLHPWPSWADDWLLSALGGEIREEGGEKVVVFNGSEYYPHTLEEEMDPRARATLHDYASIDHIKVACHGLVSDVVEAARLKEATPPRH